MYTNLQEIRSALSSFDCVSFKEEFVDGQLCTIVAYQLNDPNLWDVPMGLEARGITFGPTGELISLPFHKFFNLGEREDTQESCLHRRQLNFMAKVDGSMITPALIGKAIRLKTKKSFFSDVAISANRDMPPFIEKFCRDMLSQNLCPIFEYTHPDHKVVIDYGVEPRFTLLAVRNMADGKYIKPMDFKELARAHDIPYAKDSWGMTDGQIKSITGIEGFVLTDDQDARFRVKVKTDWYLQRHRMLDVRERDIAKLHLTDKLDDMVAEMKEAQVDMQRVGEIVSKLNAVYSDMRKQVEEVARGVTGVVGKDRAEMVFQRADPHVVPMVFKFAEGKEDRALEMIREYMIKHVIQEFPLRSISNSSFGVKGLS